MSDEIKLVVADDHPIVRKGLVQIITAAPEINVLAEAGDGETALKLIKELRPDIALLDINLPGMTGFDLILKIEEKKLPVKVIFLTMHSEEELFNEAMDAGFRGYVLKENAARDLLECIHSVADGKPFITPSLSSFLLHRGTCARALASENPGLEKLTPAERRILKLIAEDFTSKEIGDQLGISFHTVENHRANISAKLLLSGSHSLLKFAFENKSRL